MMFYTYPDTQEAENLFDTFTTDAFKADSSYPPYSIYTTNSEEPRGFIEIAITGLTEDNIKVYFDDGVLIVEGAHPEAEERIYAHRGLSTKDFVKKFKLEKNWEVKDIQAKNGLLIIELIQNKPKKQFLTINQKGN